MNSYERLRSCIVVGAGMAGLVAARRLRQDRVQVVVVDKGRGVGGRMATWRLERGVCDYGAQFFTVRDRHFERFVEQWRNTSVVEEWCRGFVDADGIRWTDVHPRYRGVSGMTGIAKYLARDLDVRTEELVVRVGTRGPLWEVWTGSGNVLTADGLVLTPPVPQSLALLDAGNIVLPAPTRRKLEAVDYHRCIALMVLLEKQSRVPPPGGVVLSGEPIRWIADNHQKGISPEAGAVTIHAGPEFSRAHWESEEGMIAGALLDAAQRWLGSKVRQLRIHRWRYSEPVEVLAEPCVAVSAPAPLVLAGDAFGGPRIEGAAISGLAAANWLRRTRAERVEAQSG